jgi:hypothetical protein
MNRSSALKRATERKHLVNFEKETLMLRYFLGDLSEEERGRFEEEYFRDDQVFAELQTVETELIDSYVRGELSESEREQFETRYLQSPDRKEKVENARCLMAALTEAAEWKQVAAMRVPIWQRILAAFRSVSLPMRIGYAMAGVAILAFGFVTLAENRSLRLELGRLRTDESNLLKRNQELERQMANLSAPSRQTSNESHEEIAELQLPQSLVASIDLEPGLSRGRKSRTNNELVIPRTARFVLLTLSLESDEYPNGYRVIVETIKRNEVERVDRLKSQSRAGGARVVEVQLSVESLTSDAYVVRLAGITTTGSEEPVEDYSFQVVWR